MGITYPGLWSEYVRRYGIRATIFDNCSDGRYEAEADRDADELLVAIAIPGRAMEYGAGSGRIALRIVNECEHLVAYEPCPELRAELTEQAKGVANITVIGTLPELGLRTLDTIYSWNVVPHLDYMEIVAFLQCARQQLKRGGVLAFDYLPWNEQGQRTFAEWLRDRGMVLHLWASEQIRPMALALGFHLTNTTTLHNERTADVYVAI